MTKKMTKRRAALRKSAHAFALNCAIRRLLRPYRELAEGGPGVVVFITPEENILHPFSTAATAELFPDDIDGLDFTAFGLMKIKRGENAKKVRLDFESDCADKTRVFVIAENREDLTENIVLAADHIFRMSPITPSCCATLNLTGQRHRW